MPSLWRLRHHISCNRGKPDPVHLPINTVRTANAPETTRRGRFISNFEADHLDGIETPLPDSDENYERGDENMDNELPKIEDGLNRLKPTNFRCELLDYDNVKNWKARMKQLLSLQQCWQVMAYRSQQE